MHFPQCRLLDRLAGLAAAAGERPLPAVGAQARRALGQQERRLAARVGLDDGDGYGGMLEAAGIGLAANIEAAEAFDDRAPQGLIETEFAHAAAGLVKVQTTAGGTLRQMRVPLTACRCRRSRRPRGTGGAGP